MMNRFIVNQVFPMLMIEKVLEITENEIKAVILNSELIKNYPLLLIEASGQISEIFYREKHQELKGGKLVLASIPDFKIHRELKDIDLFQIRSKFSGKFHKIFKSQLMIEDSMSSIVAEGTIVHSLYLA